MGRIRQEMEWDRTAAIMAACMAPHSKKKIDPNELNPYRKAKN